MAPMSNAALDLVVTHLNAPYGDLVSVEDLAAVLVGGTTKGVAERAPAAAGVLGRMFVEVSPALIGRCMVAAGATFTSVGALYAESIAHCGRVPAWERATGHLG